MSVPHKHSEGLCKHFSKDRSNATCPILLGETELIFGLDRLPPMVVAGSYQLHVVAVDSTGAQVTCVLADLDVPRGKKGEIFRRVADESHTNPSPTYGDGCHCGGQSPHPDHDKGNDWGEHDYGKGD